jgi:hypothetical protein
MRPCAVRYHNAVGVHLLVRALILITLLASIVSAQCIATCLTAHDCCDQPKQDDESCPNTVVTGELQHQQSAALAWAAEPSPVVLAPTEILTEPTTLKPAQAATVRITILRI